ncbi:MAG: MBL fold metallo-hydrolase [Spirochaetales bacterium]|nr:MAG: MBL fold metallo-hydrolase [Spirochaetales bacterium]
MQIIFLGTGTSHGIPCIACSCAICTSSDPKNARTRASIWIRHRHLSLLIDTSTDFRFQAIREGMTSLDAIFFTHAHADHLHGLDDIRPLCRDKTMPVYGNEATLTEIRSRFNYIFEDTQKGGGKPKIELISLGNGAVDLGDLAVQPVPIKHGSLDILGFRLGGFAYLTDCSGIPEESYKLLENLEILVIGALRDKPHETHFSVPEALAEIGRIRPERAYFTHLCHNLEHQELLSRLPPNVEPAYDGQVLDLGD